MMMFGVDVIVVAPGAVATPIWDKAEGADAEFAETPYAPAIERLMRYMLSARPQGTAAGTDRGGGEESAARRPDRGRDTR